MEYIEYGDLAKLINESNMTEDDAKIITRQLLEGLKVMHENSFCHRDLKPMVGISSYLTSTQRRKAKPQFRISLWPHHPLS